MAKSAAGEFTSQALLSVTQSAANTLTSEKLETGISVYDKVGWVIQRVEWSLGNATYGFFNASGDSVTAAITMTNQLTAIADENPALICVNRWLRTDFGTAASGEIKNLFQAVDYSTLSGGGLLVLPNPIYLTVTSNSLTDVGTVIARVYYKAIELSDADYFNLVQARQLLISF